MFKTTYTLVLALLILGITSCTESEESDSTSEQTPNVEDNPTNDSIPDNQNPVEAAAEVDISGDVSQNITDERVSVNIGGLANDIVDRDGQNYYFNTYRIGSNSDVKGAVEVALYVPTTLDSVIIAGDYPVKLVNDDPSKSYAQVSYSFPVEEGSSVLNIFAANAETSGKVTVSNVTDNGKSFDMTIEIMNLIGNRGKVDVSGSASVK